MVVQRWLTAPLVFATLSTGVMGAGGTGAHSSLPQANAPSAPQRRATCADAEPRDISMFVPLAHAAQFGDAMINLNSRSSVVQTVQPVWYVEGRGRVAGRPFTVPPTSISFPSLRSFLPPQVEISSVNGLELTYRGKPREVWAQVTLLGRSPMGPRQNLDVVFNMEEDYRSSRLDAVWSSVGTAIEQLSFSPIPLAIHYRSTFRHT